MKIITGHTGEKHIYAVDDAAINKLLVGNGNYVLPYGGQLALTETDSHVVTIADGYFITQGRLAVVRPGESETFNLDGGVPDYWMSYLLIAEYTIDDDGIESMLLKTVAGSLYSDEASVVDPELTTGNIDNGERHQVALWRIIMNGRSISRLERVTAVVSVSPLDEIYARVQAMETEVAQAITDMQADASTAIANIQTSADGAITNVETSAHTQINAWKPYYYGKGSVLKLSWQPCAAFLTSSGTRIQFLIPTKPIVGATSWTSIQINSLSGNIRTIHGTYGLVRNGKSFFYLSNANKWVDNGILKIPRATIYPYIKDGGIHIILDLRDPLYRNSSAVVTNNTPLSVEVTGEFVIS